jgi:hypothetical protein
MSRVRSLLAALVESDDKALFPHTKKIKGGFSDVDQLKNAVTANCALHVDDFELQYYDSEMSNYVDLDELEDMDLDEEFGSAGNGKRKRKSQQDQAHKKIKLRVVAARRRTGGLTQKGGPAHVPAGGSSIHTAGGGSSFGQALAPAPSFEQPSFGQLPEIPWHLAPLAHEDNASLSRPTIVWATFVLDQLGDIDTARCVVYVRMTMTMYWHDPRLKRHHKLGSPLPETLWAPNPRVKEEILGDFEVRVLEFTRMREDEHEGDVYMVVSYGGTITNPMDLHLFPFDYDDIEITFLANSCQLRDGTSNVAFKTDYRLLFKTPPAFEGMGVPSFRASEQFQVQGFSLVSVSAQYQAKMKAQDQIYIQLNVRRNSAYYFYKVIIPMLLIMILNTGAFAMNVHALNDRLQYSVSLFLSAFALMYVIAPDVPKTSYQTPIDRFILVTVVVLAFTGMHAVFLMHLKAGNSEQACFQLEYTLEHLTEVVLSVFTFWEWNAECTDKALQWILSVGYFSYIAYEFLPPRIKRDRWLEEQQMGMATSSEVTKLQMVSGKLLEPTAMLRLQGLEHHTSQILERPYAGAPKWLVKKFGVDIGWSNLTTAVSLDVGEDG